MKEWVQCIIYKPNTSIYPNSKDIFYSQPIFLALRHNLQTTQQSTNHCILGCLRDFAHDASSVAMLILPTPSDEILLIFKDKRPAFEEAFPNSSRKSSSLFFYTLKSTWYLTILSPILHSGINIFVCISFPKFQVS